MIKRCPKCCKDKSLNEYSKDKSKADGLCFYCKVCCSKYAKEWRTRDIEASRLKEKEWRNNNRDKVRESRYKWRYGISRSDKNQLLESQGNKCATCSRTTPGGIGHWHTDHDHKTGKVRGILCNRCNLVLGNVEDSEELLMNLCSYLNKHAHDPL